MKRSGKCFLSMMLAASMTLGSASASISANEVYAGTAKNAQKTETKKGKYISDVYIAYGKTESDAANWLTANGWEPIAGNRDFNEGKKSPDGKSVAAVMGIRRTDDVKEAITDMAVMNMKGGYSFPGYEEILEEKRAEIDDFIYSFLPTIEEYRANFNGEGSEMGQKRAGLTYELLNKFYDGGLKKSIVRMIRDFPWAICSLMISYRKEPEMEAAIWNRSSWKDPDLLLRLLKMRLRWLRTQVRIHGLTVCSTLPWMN